MRRAGHQRLPNAFETTTATKRRKIWCKICTNCAVKNFCNLSFHGYCISRSLHDSARVVISRLLTRNCCSLAVVVSATFVSQWWPGGEVLVSRSLLLWDLGGSNWDTRKSWFRGCSSFMCGLEVSQVTGRDLSEGDTPWVSNATAACWAQWLNSFSW